MIFKLIFKSIFKSLKDMKKFKLIYTNPVDYAGDANTFESEYTFFMLSKRILWWYFPLYIKTVKSIPYEPQLNIKEVFMHTNDKTELLEFFNGYLKFDSFTSNRPIYYYMEKAENRLNYEYFNSKEELLNNYAEFYI